MEGRGRGRGRGVWSAVAMMIPCDSSSSQHRKVIDLIILHSSRLKASHFPICAAPSEEEEEEEEESAVEQVLKELILERLCVRSVWAMRSVSRLFHSIPLQDLAWSPVPDLQRESWLLLHKIPHDSEIIGTCPLSFFPWDFQVFSDYDRTFFSPPPLLNTTPSSSSSWLKNNNSLVVDLGELYKEHRPALYSTANGLICACVLASSLPPPTNSSSNWDRRLVTFNILTGAADILPVGPDWDPARPPLKTRGRYPNSENMDLCEDKFFIVPSPAAAAAAGAGDAAAYYILYIRPHGKGLFRDYFQDWLQDASFQVYDSSTRLWKIPRPISLAQQDSYELLNCDFFSLRMEVKSLEPLGASLLGYRVSTDRWWKTTVLMDMEEWFPDRRANHHLAVSTIVKQGGRLLILIAEWMLEVDRPVVKVVEVSPVSAECSSLPVVSVMPDSLRQPGFPLVLHGAHIFCVSFIPDVRSFKPTPRHHIVVYDIPKDIWYPITLPSYSDHISWYRCFCVVEPRRTLLNSPSIMDRWNPQS